MIVPAYWAEARLQRREGGKQVTLRRFGWSDIDPADAQRLADERVQAAMERTVRGEKLPRREPRIAYNGAEGVPIREEILARDADAVITRNAYGAHCLNTPNVLFADIDFDLALPIRLARIKSGGYGLLALLVAVALFAGHGWFAIPLVAAAFVLRHAVRVRHRAELARDGGPGQAARRKVAAFAATHPDWALRVYLTPAGLRLLATHRLFEPDEPATRELFAAVGVDRAYARMCERQQCFRARLTAKPWRIGIAGHMRPRPGVWPVNPERLADRAQWIAAYELTARDWAACRFVEALGSGVTHVDVEPVRRLHDDACRATSTLPIA